MLRECKALFLISSITTGRERKINSSRNKSMPSWREYHPISSISASSKTSVIFKIMIFSFCVYCVHMRVHLRWRPDVHVECLSYSLSTLSFDGLSLNLELVHSVRLANSKPQASFLSASPGLESQALAAMASFLVGASDSNWYSGLHSKHSTHWVISPTLWLLCKNNKN